MKRNIILLILIASPLIGQEKTEQESARRSIDYKRPVFGLNFDLGYSYNIMSSSGLVSGFSLEFYLGKKSKVYFYMKIPLGYQYYPYKHQSNTDCFIVIPSFNAFYLGFFIGMGGYILEADKYNPWSVVMNGAIGGNLLFTPTALGNGYNGTSTWLWGEGVAMYIDFLSRYHINDDVAIQFGPTFTIIWPILPKMNVSFQVGLAF